MSDNINPMDQMSGFLTKSEEEHMCNDDFVQRALPYFVLPDFVSMDKPTELENYGLSMQRNNNSILCTDEYPGSLEFTVSIIGDPNKSSYEYSTTLNKVFINMLHRLPIEFCVENRPANKNLYVRATPTYSSPQHAQEFVLRCINHAQEDDPSNKDMDGHIRWHVLRCDKQSTLYNIKENKEHLSLVFPLDEPQAGSKTVRELFRFACKTSCVNGMNRRPIQVIFTLEDESGAILGRRNLHVRICSCPKRDKHKEETDLNQISKKRKLTGKASTSNTDTKEYSLNLKVMGKENAKAIVRFARDHLLGERLNASGSSDNALYNKYINNFNNILNNFNSE